MAVRNSRFNGKRQSFPLVKPPYVHLSPVDRTNTRSSRISEAKTNGGYSGKNIGA